MCGEDLVVMMGRQVTCGIAKGNGLLDPHHDGIGETAQQHDQAEDHVHDADFLVIDAGKPFEPKVAPQLEMADCGNQCDTAKQHGGEGGDQDRFVEGYSVPTEAT